MPVNKENNIPIISGPNSFIRTMNRLVLTVVSVCILLSKASGLAVPNQRISNGDATKEGDFPYIVSISVNSEHICGGFIYNQRFVVTAASCVNGLTPAEVAVVVGQYNLIFPDPNERRFQVVNIISHEAYNSANKLNDIAVLETSQSIIFTTGHVECAYYNEANFTAPAATVIGWGATEEGGLPSVDLRKTEVTLSTTDCEAYGSDGYLANYMLCAGNVTSSPCVYDEGSPLIQPPYVIGIMSKNNGCIPSPTILPTIYTRLSSYYAWLNRNAGQQPVPPAL